MRGPGRDGALVADGGMRSARWLRSLDDSPGNDADVRPEDEAGVHLAAGDSIAPAASLQKLVAGRTSNGVEFDVHLYEGAHHRFDVAHPVEDPAGKTPGDHDGKASAEAQAAIDRFLEKYAINADACALD